MSAKTLPAWMVGYLLPVDAARKAIRESEQLKALGTMVGPVRVYSEREAELIRDAVLARRAKFTTAGARWAVVPAEAQGEGAADGRNPGATVAISNSVRSNATNDLSD